MAQCSRTCDTPVCRRIGGIASEVLLCYGMQQDMITKMRVPELQYIRLKERNIRNDIVLLTMKYTATVYVSAAACRSVL